MDWRDVVGILAMAVGSIGLVLLAGLGIWLARRPQEELEGRLSRHFLRRRNGDRRRQQPPAMLPAHWFVRSGTDRRHGGGRRQGH